MSLKTNLSAVFLFLLAISCCSDDSTLTARDASADGPSQDTSTAEQEVGTQAPNDETACYFGVAFADCPGATDPKAYCAFPGGCLWVNNGISVGAWDYPLTADCSAPSNLLEATPTMASFVYGYGDKPWDRTRVMNVDVEIQGSTSSGPQLSCMNCTGDCNTPSTPCGATDVVVDRQAPGTFVLRLRSYVALAGWYLEVEIDADTQPMTARACRIAFTDDPTCVAGTPICATTGTIRLDAIPSKENWPQSSGQLDVTFPDGLGISATF